MDLTHEVRTDKPFEDAVSSLKASLKERQFGVLWELNFKEKLSEHDLDFGPNFKIFEVCNPRQARDVLSKNIEVGYFLPCKLVVYEKSQEIWIGMLNPLELIRMMGVEELTPTAEDVQETLRDAITAAST